MVLTSTILKSASAVLPLAGRIVVQRYSGHCRSLVSAANHSRLRLPTNSSFFPLVCRYSAASAPTAVNKRSRADESLLRVIEAEIQDAEDTVEKQLEDLQVEEVPQGFPFKIVDNLGQQTVSLTREYQGETIVVEIEIPELNEDAYEDEDEDEDENDDADDHDDDDEEEEEDGADSSVEMVVKVSKPGAPSLEFGVTGYPDDVIIESVSVKDPAATDAILPYEGPKFEDLDENLQKAFLKYLEIRGIKASIMGYLFEYMVNKEHREYTNWLKNLKKFIEA